jgi:predicted ATPase
MREPADVSLLRAVEWHNFKCFERERIELGTITLVTGLNGSGKSSFIQGLLLLRQSELQGLLRQGRLALNGDLVQIGAGHDVFCEYAEDKPEDEVVSLGLEWQDGAAARWGFAYDRKSDVLTERAADISSEAFARLPLRGELHYLAAERLGPRASSAMSDYAVEHQRQIGQRGEYAAHFLACFGRTHVAGPERLHPEASSDLLLAQVQAWLGEVSPAVRVEVVEHRAMDAVEMRFSFAGPHGPTSDYRPMNVGFGLTYTLAVVVAALAAPPGALLIVENPEAHLNPRAQVRVTGLLARAAKAGVQTIIETHSDHVLNGLRLAVHDGLLPHEEARIHYFERRVTPERIYHTVISPRIDADGRIEPWPPGFFDEMEIALGRLMEPRGGAA